MKWLEAVDDWLEVLRYNTAVYYTVIPYMEDTKKRITRFQNNISHPRN